MKAIFIKVAGDVQGVNFRYWTKKTADSIGLIGWTKNEHDGSVFIFAQGSEDKVDKLIEWTHSGSPMSTVEEVKVTEAPTKEGLKGFSVK